MNNEEAAFYDKYDFDVVSAASNGYSYDELSIIDLILSMCTKVNSSVIGKENIDTYESASLYDYFHDCEKITNIELVGNKYLYIYYTTNHNEEIYLCYSEFGLHNRVIYDTQTDSAVYTENGKTMRLFNYRGE